MSGRARFARYARDLKSLPKDAAVAYRRGGIRDLWEEVAERSVHRVLRWGRLLVIAQRLEDFREVAPPPDVTIRRATAADLPALVDVMSSRGVKHFREHLTRGRICLVAWRGPRPIGYAWNADKITSDMIACPLALPPTAAFLSSLYVVPGERGSGVGSALASARLSLARDCGFREGWRLVAPTNHASLRTVAKTSGPSTQILGELRYIKLLARIYGRFHPSVTYPARSA